MNKKQYVHNRIVKLREWKNRPKKDGKFFISYVVSVPPDLVNELGWKKGQELKAKSEGKKLVIEKE